MLKEVASPVDLNISSEKVCYIVVKAREFDVKVAPVEPDPASNPTDDGEREVLEDYASDPTFRELRQAIMDLNEDEVVDLIAIAWLGRGDFERGEFENGRRLAAERHRANSAPYLTGMPSLGDYLENGLSELGYSCEDTERRHL